MELTRLVEAVEQVRATSKKSEKIRILADTLCATEGFETGLAAMYLSGSLAQGKIGVGWSLIQQSLEESGVFRGAPHVPLMLTDVHEALEQIAGERGSGSTERRIADLKRLFSRASPEERRFLTRLLMGELRQGALEGVLLDAIAAASKLAPTDVRQAFMFAPTIGELA